MLNDGLLAEDRFGRRSHGLHTIQNQVMKSDFDLSGLPSLLERQLSGFFPVSEDEISLIKEAMPAVLGRVGIAWRMLTTSISGATGKPFLTVPFRPMAHILMLCDQYAFFGLQYGFAASQDDCR